MWNCFCRHFGSKLSSEDSLVVPLHLLHEHCIHALLIAHRKLDKGRLNVKVTWKLHGQNQNVNKSRMQNTLLSQ